MKTYEVDVGGKTYEVDAPDEATAWKWANATHKKAAPLDLQGMQRQALSREQLRQQIESDPISRGAREASQETDLPRWLAGDPAATTAERVTSSLPVSFALGASALPRGAAQLASNAVGLGDSESNPFGNQQTAQLEQMRQRGGVSGSGVAKFAGEVMSPVGLIAAKSFKPAETWYGRAAQGSGIGGAYGAAAPVENEGDYWGDKITQANVGSAVGAGIPLTLDAGRKVYRAGRHVYRGAVEPFFQRGRDAAEGRDYVLAARDRASEIADALRNPSPAVAGYKPTAGEIVAALPKSTTQQGQAEFVGHQANVSAKAPSTVSAVQQEQNKALVDEIRRFGGTPSGLEAARANRSNVAGALYENARNSGVDTTNKDAAKIVSDLFKRPALKTALQQATVLAKNEGVNLKNAAGQVTGLDYTKRALDDMISAANGNERRVLQDLKEEFISAVDQLSPQYAKARSTFAEMSVPVNQMEIGQALEGKLTGALRGDEALRAEAYANALKESSQLPKKLGMPRYRSIDEALIPANRQITQNVEDILANQATTKALGSAGSAKASSLTGTPEIQIPNLFNQKVALTKALLRTVMGKGTERMDEEMARDMLTNPQQVAKLMAEALRKADTMEQRVQLIRKYSPLATQGIATEGVQ